MSARKPDRRALEARLRDACAERGVSEPGLEELELLHQLGLAYGCYAPRKLERASELYEQALQVIWDREGPESLRAIPVLASWIECAQARGAASGPTFEAMRQRAEALAQRAEAAILAREPGADHHYAGTYTLLQRLGSESRAIRLLHVVSPAWDPRPRAPKSPAPKPAAPKPRGPKAPKPPAK